MARDPSSFQSMSVLLKSNCSIEGTRAPSTLIRQSMETTVNHLACSNAWEDVNERIESPKCLILGSFNPNVTSNSEVPFYYCRKPGRGVGNRFWPAVMRILSIEKDCRQNEQARLEAMKRGKFLFMDLIDSITISSPNSTKAYVDTEIASFSDSSLWADNPKGHTLIRTYNTRIFDVIKKHQESLQYVVFTLGPSGLDPLIRRNKHGSLSRRDSHWRQFYSQLVETCSTIDTLSLVTETCSPAPQGRRLCPDEKLRAWLKTYVIHE